LHTGGLACDARAVALDLSMHKHGHMACYGQEADHDGDFEEV